jgi:hypothetical protein
MSELHHEPECHEVYVSGAALGWSQERSLNHRFAPFPSCTDQAKSVNLRPPATYLGQKKPAQNLHIPSPFFEPNQPAAVFYL